MAAYPRAAGTGQQTLKQLSEGLLESAGRTGFRGNVLEIHHPRAPLFDPVFLHVASESRGLSISLSQFDASGVGQRVACSSAQLPFQDHVFNMVVLHHVVGNGDEAELAEAARVLARNGVLLLLGLNRIGWRYRAQGRAHALPGLAPFRVRTQLERLGLTMQGFVGAGLCGQPRPAFMGAGVSLLATPLADVLLLQARHQDSPEATPLRFGKPRSSVVQSALMRG